MLLSYNNNHNVNDIPKFTGVLNLFQEHLKKAPNRTAIYYQNQKISYAELANCATNLAIHLKKYRLKTENIIAISIDNSPQMIVSILAAFMINCAYLPLDPKLPRKRRQYLLEDANVNLVITTPEREALFSNFKGEILSLNKHSFQTSENHNSINNRDLYCQKPHHLAYVIYTSGSTGHPKGVMIENKSLAERLLALKEIYSLSDQDIFIFYRSFMFDGAIEEFLLPLITGASYVIVPSHEILKLIPELIQLIKKYGVTHINIMPSLMHYFLDYCQKEPMISTLPSLKRIISGGEILNPDLARTCLDYFNVDLFNVYGPTENTIDSTFYLCKNVDEKKSIPIGKPLPPTQVYILNKQLQHATRGTIGEIYLGGDSLARGYLGQPELTLEKFIPNPFSDNPNDKLYKTGDLGRWLSDGNIEFLGRVDDQIKIRGYRIEPLEIQHHILQFPTIRQCIVLTKTEPRKQLIAYIISDNAKNFSIYALQKHLLTMLPKYMIPSSFVLLDYLPTTVTGKIDRNKLTNIKTTIPQKNTIIQQDNNIQKQLLNIWNNILHIETTSIDKSFFMLGGDSLSAMQLIYTVEKIFNIKIDIQDVFEHCTIRSLGNYIEKTLQETKQQVVQTSTISQTNQSRSCIPISYAQQRLWLIAQLNQDSPVYNVPCIYQIQGELNQNALEKTLVALTHRHEIFRTVFKIQQKKVCQKILPTKTLSNFLEKHTGPCTQKQALNRIKKIAKQPFDLFIGPLIRCHLFYIDQDKHILLINLHHIITDEWSIHLMQQDIGTLYQRFLIDINYQYNIPKLQYRHFTKWQYQHLSDRIVDKDVNYWQKQLKNTQILNLPTDCSRPLKPNFQGKRFHFKLTKKQHRALQELSRQQSATLFMTLLSIFDILLSIYAQQSDIAIGTPVASRYPIETENMLGFFSNTLVLRTQMVSTSSFLTLLNQNKKIVLEAFNRQNIPFDILVRKLAPSRNPNINPFFQAMLVLEPFDTRSLNIPGLKINRMNIDPGFSMFDLTLFVQQTKNPNLQGNKIQNTAFNHPLDCTFEYNSELFHEKTIANFANHFRELVDQIIKFPSIPICNLRILTQGETAIIYKFSKAKKIREEDLCNKPIPKQFEHQAQKHPNKTAILWKNQQISFEKLNNQANQLAHYLHKLGIQKDELVGICIPRSPEMIISLLAILKTGASYIPLDPNYPSQRIQLMIKDSKLRFLLINNIISNQILNQRPILKKPNAINLDNIKSEINKFPTYNLNISITNKQPVYVIYTSGSTGKPKGVVIEHQALNHFLISIQKKLNFKPSDKFLVLTSLSFDISALEIFLPLRTGGTCVLADTEWYAKLDDVHALIDHHQITFIQTTPSLWRLLLQGGWKHQHTITMVCGGESLPKHLAQKLLLAGTRTKNKIWNLYGPTEATIWSAAYALDKNKALKTVISIGKPLPGYEIWILNPNQQTLPVGVQGEIYIGGASLAHGYLRQPELTHEKFIPNPFSDNPNDKLYKTGDLGRWLSDGNIEFLGRTDTQIKKDGIRIELGEIEHHLNQHPYVTQAVINLQPTSNASNSKNNFSGSIIAYIIPNTQNLHKGALNINNTVVSNPQTAYWKDIWEATYKSKQNDSPKMQFGNKKLPFNTAGWRNSYTNKPFSKKEMQEWVITTINRIKKLNPKKILEIGCGTGLLLFPLATEGIQCDVIEPSLEAINYIKSQIPLYNIQNNVRIFHGFAHETKKHPIDQYDLIIINSVVQYFPNIQYFIQILNQSLDLLAPKGNVFLGDIRSLTHLEFFHADVLFHKQLNPNNVKHQLIQCEQRILNERELLIDPSLFHTLMEQHPKIHHADVLLKKGLDNEMTKFRYDVILYTCTDKEIFCPDAWEDTSQLNSNDKIYNELYDKQPAYLAIKNVPNNRITPIIQKLTTIKKEHAVYSRCSINDPRNQSLITSIDIDKIWEIASKLGYEIHMTWSKIDPHQCVDIIFYKNDNQLVLNNSQYQEKIKKSQTINHKKKVDSINYDAFSNIPVFSWMQTKIISALKKYTETHLPNHMWPNAYVFVKSFLKTPNNKIDRKALANLSNTITLEKNIPLGNKKEQNIAKTLATILNISEKTIFANSNFFVLGGHSLLAIQFITKLNKKFNSKLTLNDIFLTPTIRELSQKIIDQATLD